MITHAHTVTVDIVLEVLAQLASGARLILQVSKSIGTGRYRKQLEEGLIYAWKSTVDALPSYRSGKHFIGSKDGFLVQKNSWHFLDGLVEWRLDYRIKIPSPHDRYGI